MKKFDEAIDWARQRVELVSEPIDLEPAVRAAATIISKSSDPLKYITGLAAKEDTISPQARCLLAELYEQEGDHDRADQLLNAATENELILSQKIRVLRLREDWVGAAQSIENMLAETGGSRKSNYLRDLVYLYQRAGDFKKALSWIPEWKKVSPGSVEPWFTESTIYQDQGQDPEALRVLESAARKFDREIELKSRLAGLYHDLGKDADARRILMDLYESSEQLSDKMRWISQVARIASIEGVTEQLVEEFQERRRQNRQSIAPLLALAEIHRNNNQYEERRQALLEASRLRSGDVDFLVEIARIEEQEGEWESALKTLNRARKIEDTPKIGELIAELQLRYGDEEAGYRQLDELALKNPDTDTLVRLAESIISRYEWERAADFLEPRIEKFGDDYRLWYIYGCANEESDNIPKAIEAFSKILAIKKEIKSKRSGFFFSSRQSQSYYTVLEKSLPPGSKIFISYQRYLGDAYRHRRRNNNYRYSYSRYRPSILTMPKSWEEAHALALAHIGAAKTQLDEEEELPDLYRRLERVGGVDYGVLARIDYMPGSYSSEIPDELLDQYPEHTLLHYLWYGERSGEGGIELERAERAFGLFEKSAPVHAILVAKEGLLGDPEKGRALFEKALKLVPKLTQGSYLSINALGTLLSRKKKTCWP